MSQFNWKEHCLFCGEDCHVLKDPKNPSRWRKVYFCRTSFGNQARNSGLQSNITQNMWRETRYVAEEVFNSLQDTCVCCLICMLLVLGTTRTAKNHSQENFLRIPNSLKRWSMKSSIALLSSWDPMLLVHGHQLSSLMNTQNHFVF